MTSRLKTAKEATRSKEDSDFTVLYFILLSLLAIFLFMGFYWLKQRWNRRFERQLQARIRHVKAAEFDKKKRDIDDKILKKVRFVFHGCIFSFLAIPFSLSVIENCGYTQEW